MTTKRRDPKPRPEHVKRARDFIAKNFDGDVDFLEEPLAIEFAKLARVWRDEVKRVRAFARACCCPICGWEPSRCECKRPR